MPGSGRNAVFLVLLLLALLLAIGSGVRSCERPEPASSPTKSGAGATTASPNSAEGSGSTGTGAGDVRAPKVDANGPRLTALTFVMDRSGLKVADTLTAPGRAKAPPTSVAANQLEFTLEDAKGQVVYQGALDHPLRRVEEYEDPARPGEFKRLARELDSDAFQLRYPAGLNARTVTFVERLTIGGQVRRNPLGTFPIP